jgi:hypothetical protein
MSNPLCGKYLDQHPNLEDSSEHRAGSLHGDWRDELSAKALEALEAQEDQRNWDERNFDDESRHLPPPGNLLHEECDY